MKGKERETDGRAGGRKLEGGGGRGVAGWGMAYIHAFMQMRVLFLHAHI